MCRRWPTFTMRSTPPPGPLRPRPWVLGYAGHGAEAEAYTFHVPGRVAHGPITQVGARAKARGVHMGQPPKLTAYQRQEALARRVQPVPEHQMSEPEGIPAVDHRDGVSSGIPAGEPARYWAAYLRSLVTEDG